MLALHWCIHEKKMLDTKRPFNLLEISTKACYQAKSKMEMKHTLIFYDHFKGRVIG